MSHIAQAPDIGLDMILTEGLNIAVSEGCEVTVSEDRVVTVSEGCAVSVMRVKVYRTLGRTAISNPGRGRSR